MLKSRGPGDAQVSQDIKAKVHRRLLETLKDRGLTMYLASGTDQVYMREEADLLDVSKYFDGVYGALESAGAQDNVALRNDLYATVLRLKEPWASVNLRGVTALLLSVVALVILWRKRE